MKATLTNILNVLDKERKKGYGDNSVFGGLTSFVEIHLNMWPGKESPWTEDAIKIVANYSRTNMEGRQRIVDQLSELIALIDRADQTNNVHLTRPKTTFDYVQPLPPIKIDGPEKVTSKKETKIKKISTKKAAKPKAATPVSNKPAENSVQWVKNVGPKRTQQLKKLNIETIEDLIEYYPRRYEDRREVVPLADVVSGQACTIKGFIMSVNAYTVRRGMQILKASLKDESGTITVVWFNQPWLKDKIKVDAEIVIYGRADFSYGKRQFTASECLFSNENTFGIKPIYGLTEGLSHNYLSGIISNAIGQSDELLKETFPKKLREKYNLIGKKEAVTTIHRPETPEDIATARRRLVFEEFFMQCLARSDHREDSGVGGICHEGGQVSDYSRLLPFELTGAQKRALTEIYEDMASPKKMARLLEGDVGSGKTAVAAGAIYKAIFNRFQAALMAPTELLATQHFRSLSSLFQGTGIRLALLTGTTKVKDRREIYNGLAEGRIDVVIGTHALIEDKTVFRNLSLVIIDEQHRFGVNQRERLLSKGIAPDLLVLTATPIPRTLAMAVFGNLAVSVLDELPPGRKPIQTKVIKPDEVSRALQVIKTEVEHGGQAYIVCPLIEDSETLDFASTTEFYERVKDGVFKDLNVGLLHGKMSAKDKDAVMEGFRSGTIGVLVATTVIEVGVDVPNATIMLIRDAHRFGLAQLHQIRGRIGRGVKDSLCYLENGGKGELPAKRLDVMEKSTDGFYIAEEDLKLRGPGDFFGTRQHGLAGLKLADLVVDHDILKEAKEAADKIMEHNPTLEGDSFAPIRKILEEKYAYVF